MVSGRTSSPSAAACGAALVGLILLALAACAPAIAPQGLESAPPAIETDVFVTRDRLRLPLRHWDAANPKAVIVALHGMSDYSEAFDMPGPWWAAHGVEVYAYDQRGFGQAPDPGIWAGADTMRHDLADFVDVVRMKYPGVPVYALGESMGGAVVLSSLASDHPPRVDGVILVAPAVWSRADMPFYYSAALWVGVHTFPWVHVSGNGLKIWPSDNIPMLKKLSRDPLFQHDTRIDQLYGLVGLMDEARRAPSRIAVDPPILLLYGDKDQVIPAPPTKAVIAALGAHASVNEYPKGYHMLLRDLEGETVWSDVLTWIGKTGAAGHPPN
ncbi:MAG: lysophospholipase [Rhizomicrobium sp.]|jgi:alpha-beta hydrolase superfamily lysophospholipase